MTPEEESRIRLCEANKRIGDKLHNVEIAYARIRRAYTKKTKSLVTFKRTTMLNVRTMVEEFRLAIIDREKIIEELHKEIDHLRSKVMPELQKEVETLRKESQRLVSKDKGTIDSCPSCLSTVRTVRKALSAGICTDNWHF